MRKLLKIRRCFVCGSDNDAGLNIEWFHTSEGVHGEYEGQVKHNSFEGIVHGGIISTLLDECIGWAVGLKEKRVFVTGNLNVTFKELIPVGKKVTINGCWKKNPDEEKKYSLGHGNIIDDDGVVYATAEGKFFLVPKEFQEVFLKMLEYPDNQDKEFTFADVWGELETEK